MPLQRIVPKFGFTNFNRVEYCPVNLSTLQKLADNGIAVITPEVLVENGVIHSKELVKILAKGYFTALANGNSKMYHSDDMERLVKKAGLVVETIHDGLGHGHSIMVCKK